MALAAQPGDMAACNQERGAKGEWTVAELQETLGIGEAEAQTVKSIPNGLKAKMREAKKAQIRTLQG